jgi:hypothetical protein
VEGDWGESVCGRRLGMVERESGRGLSMVGRECGRGLGMVHTEHSLKLIHHIPRAACSQEQETGSFELLLFLLTFSLRL